MTICTQCLKCDNFLGSVNSKKQNTGRCFAFDIIPKEIFLGIVSHDKPYPGDNNFRFELRRGYETPTIATTI